MKFSQVSSLGEAEGNGSKEDLSEMLNEGSGDGSGSGSESEEEVLEQVHVDEDFYYMMHVMRLAAALHSLVSLAMLIAYYHLKVNLMKYVAKRRLGFCFYNCRCL